MKLSRIRLEKFRGLREADIKVGTELALVGQNSGGKSSILRALNAFFNFPAERDNFESSRHSFQKTSTAIIDLEFSDSSAECNLPRTEDGGNNVRLRLKYRKSANWEIFENGAWRAAPQGFQEALQNHVRYVYIPVARTDKVLNWGQGSILQEAVSSWVKNYTSKRDRISPRVAEANGIIKDRTLRGLSKHLRGLTHLNGSFEFDLDYLAAPDYNLLIQGLGLKVIDGKTSIDISDCGSGTQSLAAIGLYSYLADTIGGTYILGIEEPEQNLHPQAQRSLLSALKQMPLQVLFTTHSTVMIDSLEHEEIALCRRVSSTTRGFEITVTQLPDDFWTSKEIDRSKYYNFYKRRNSELFFADYVILTESPIDSELVKHLLESGGLDFSKHSVSIVSLDGVTSLPYAYHLLKELNINFASVVDKDYFLPYLNDELEISRDARGFPRYKKEFKQNCLIESIFPEEEKRENLLNLFMSNHSRAMGMLEDVGFFCFRFSMDIDLAGSNTAIEILFDNFDLQGNERNSQELLVSRRKQLKKQETVLGVTRALAPGSLPNSYKRIRKKIPELVNQSSV